MNHADWQARGFRTIPIIPPRAGLANPLNKALAHERGKAPGLMNPGGRWFGFGGWRTEAAPPPATLDAWGASVGLPTDGLLAVDIDTMDDGLAAALEAATVAVAGTAPLRIGRAPKRLILYAAAVPTTKHSIVFRWPGAEQGEKPERIEVMADGQQIVVDGEHPGTGKPYAWPNGRPVRAALPVLTLEALAALMERWRAIIEAAGCTVLGAGAAAAGTDRAAGDQAALRAPSAEVLAQAVAAMPNDGAGYDEWIPGLCAIKAAAAGLVEDDGAELARDWTARWTGGGGAGEPIDFDAKWRQLRGPFSAGWPWIERRARSAGWTGSAAVDFAALGLTMAPPAAELALRAATGLGDDGLTIQERMFRDWRWIEAVKRFGCIVDGSVLDALQFSARLLEIGPPTSGTKSAAAVFLADERRRMVAGLTYHPGAPREVHEDGLGLCFNRWRPSSLVPATGLGASDEAVSPWLRHVEMLVPDPRKRAYLLNWMASVAQHQAVKPNWAPVIGGLPGIGKDLAVSPLVRLLGAANVSTIGMVDLASEQNDWCAEARMVIVNEAHSFERIAMAEKLKPHLAAPPWLLRINTKFVPQFKQPNRHAMLFFTNRRDALPIEDGDRRYFVVWCDCEKQPDAYFEHLWGWLDAGGYAAVAGWLLARDLVGFSLQGGAPWTAEKGEMARDTMTEVAAAVADGFEEDGGWPDLVNPGDLEARLNAGRGGRRGYITARSIAVALKQAGARAVNGGVMVRLAVPCMTGADRVRLFSLRNHATYEAMPPVALAREFSRLWAGNDGAEFKQAAPPLKVVTPGDLL